MIKKMTLGTALLLMTLGTMSAVNAQSSADDFNSSRSNREKGTIMMSGSGMYGTGVRQEIKENKEQIATNKKIAVENRQEFRIDYGFAKDYLRTDLTAIEKKELLKLKNTIHNEIKAVVTSTTLTTDEKVAKLKDMKLQYGGMVAPYIQSEKLNDFYGFVYSRIELYAKNQALRDNNKELRSENKDLRVKLLSEKNVKAINKKLDNVSDEKKVEVYTALITRIDLMISNTSDATKVQVLTELKMLVQKKLDEINNTNPTTDTIVDSVLGSI